MALNWSSIVSTLSGLTSALSAAGVSASSMGSILNAIGLASNPNESAEIAICGQLLTAAGNAQLEEALVMKLATEQGIPADAASLAMTILTPGANIPQIVLEVEQLIKQGG